MRILLIEDNEKLALAIQSVLEKEGFETDLCADGEDGLYYITSKIYDLILLDRMLPGLDGVTLLKKARAEGVTTPVLMMTALGEIEDKVEGLDAGADDYLPKPFDFRELLARVRALTRRPAELEPTEELAFGDLILDTQSLILLCGKKRCTLSKKEAELLEVLMKNGNRTLSRDVLFSKVWGLDSDVEEANLASYVLFVRKRLAAVESGVQLHTVRGVGYSLADEAPC